MAEAETPPTNPERAPKAISPSDPCAASTTRGHEFLLAAIVQNPKRLAKTLWKGSSDTVAACFA